MKHVLTSGRHPEETRHAHPPHGVLCIALQHAVLERAAGRERKQAAAGGRLRGQGYIYFIILLQIIKLFN